MNMVIFGTCIGVMVLYQVIATFGYFTFHQLLIEVAAGGDILNMYVVGLTVSRGHNVYSVSSVLVRVRVLVQKLACVQFFLCFAGIPAVTSL